MSTEHVVLARPVTRDGIRMYTPACTCGWSGTEVYTPELATSLALAHAADRNGRAK